MTLKNLKWSLFFLLVLYGLAAIFAALSHRTFFADGSHWLFHMVGNQQFFWDGQYWRLITLALEAPAIWLCHLIRSTSIVTLVLELAFNLHPFLSLAACYYILKRQRREDLFVFPVLSFALCTGALMSYPSLVIPETLSVFWPLLFLVVNPDREGLGRAFFIGLGFVAMAFSYEAAVLLMGVLGIAVYWQRRSSLSRWQENYYLGLCFAVILFMLWRLFEPHAGPKQQFVTALLNSRLDPFRALGIGAALVIAFCVFWLSSSRWAKSFFYLATIAGPAAFLVYIFYRFDLKALGNPVWEARTTTIPICSVFAGLACYMALSKRQRNLEFTKGLYVFTCAVLLASLVQDILLTRFWRLGYGAIQELREQGEGCNVISPEAFQNKIETPYGFSNWWLPFVTAGFEYSASLNKIFFVETALSGKTCLVKDNFIDFDDGKSRMGIGFFKNYDVSQLSRGPIGIFEWDSATQKFAKKTVSRESYNESPAR